jgi:hypothetical protein
MMTEMVTLMFALTISPVYSSFGANFVHDGIHLLSVASSFFFSFLERWV